MTFDRIGIRRKSFCQQCISAPSVEIVRIDCGKRFVEFVCRGKDRMPGSPRFGSAFRQFIRRGQVFQILECIFDLNVFFPSGTYFFPENFFDVAADDENNFAESALDRIV